METYCIREKKYTKSDPDSVNIVELKNGRHAMKSKCSSCGINKFRFVSNKEISGKGIDIHKMIGKLPRPKKGWVLPGHRYTGPFNDLENQVKWDSEGNILEIYDPPASATDAVAMQHDVDYSVCRDDKACKHKADRKMVAALDAIPYKDRAWGHFAARNIINTKQKLGLGKKKH